MDYFLVQTQRQYNSLQLTFYCVSLQSTHKRHIKTLGDHKEVFAWLPVKRLCQQVKLAAAVKNGKVSSSFSAAKNGQVSSNFAAAKMVKLAAILWQRKTVKLARNFCSHKKFC